MGPELGDDFLLNNDFSVTVRVGTPTVTPLGGENAGARIRLDSPPQSVVATSKYLGSEKNFITIENSLWTAETDANQTEAIWIRLYAYDIDIAVDAELYSYVTRSQRMLNRTLRTHQFIDMSIDF